MLSSTTSKVGGHSGQLCCQHTMMSKALWRVAVVSEVPALKLKLDSDPLPFACIYLTLCLAIWESRLNCFNVITQLTGNHPEEKHNALLVYRFMT